MALTATVYNFNIALSDVDRGVYETFSLQLARHPSESMPYLLTRLLAYCLEYQEGITFTKGLAEADEPAIWAHDLTGKITLWVEIGTPKAERLHRASKLGARVVVYMHKDPAILLDQLQGKQIFNADQIKIYGFASSFLQELEAKMERRPNLSVSVSERQIYVSVDGNDLNSTITEHAVGPK